MKIVAKTDKGKVRSSNQDAYAVGEFPDEVAWAVVCDGMGGAAGGNIASALAVKVISDKINAAYRANMKPSSIHNMLDSALVAANIEVYDLADANRNFAAWEPRLFVLSLRIPVRILRMQGTAVHIFLRMMTGSYRLQRITAWFRIL